jgi:hypothetical protein
VDGDREIGELLPEIERHVELGRTVYLKSTCPACGEHAQLTLAFVQIKPYRIHGGWPPVPLRCTTAFKVVGRCCPHCRGWPAASSQLCAIR